jgi:hypothetical protein
MDRTAIVIFFATAVVLLVLEVAFAGMLWWAYDVGQVALPSGQAPDAGRALEALILLGSAVILAGCFLLTAIAAWHFFPWRAVNLYPRRRRILPVSLP